MLAAGTRIGPYEVLSVIGAGGMGEVYRARDSRIGRDFAVKVMPNYMSSDVSQKRRLEREAQSISSLNHPDICQLYDIGCQDGIDYIVIEYVDGEPSPSV